MEIKHQETLDAELVALAALVFMDAILMDGSNKVREREGAHPAYTDDSESDNYKELKRQVHIRGLALKENFHKPSWEE